MGTHIHRLDAKSRVSVPAAFRPSLRDSDDGPVKLILRKSTKYACVEGWPLSGFAALARRLEKLEQFSDDYDDLATDIFGTAVEVEADKEGRIVLPVALSAHASIASAVAFMGIGELFQLWDPETIEQRQASATRRVRDSKLTLPRADA